MDQETKTRVCLSCEGRIVDSSKKCPYCGADPLALPTSKEPHATPYKLVEPKQEQSIPVPPYRPAASEMTQKDALQEQVAAFRTATKPVVETAKVKEPVVAIEEVIEKETKEPSKTPSKSLTRHELQRHFVASLILTLAGSTFLLFGLALYLFGTDGELRVSWSSHWWPLYLALSGPMLLLSWFFLKKLDQQEAN